MQKIPVSTLFRHCTDTNFILKQVLNIFEIAKAVKYLAY